MSGWWPPGRWRSSSRGRLREQMLVLAGLVGFVGAVYVAVVIVVGQRGPFGRATPTRTSENRTPGRRTTLPEPDAEHQQPK